MIDEKELVKILKKNSIFKTVTNAEGKNIYEIIEDMQKVNEWIQVEERLPKQREPVIVTYISVFNELICDDCAMINENGNWIWCFDESLVELQIIAWTPLPKPYKEVK